jgi:predicted 2-oxoglutarate/Fe(II)-dependent dioxygenase YbiX
MIVRAFLAADEIAALIALASQTGWIAGRQGTGYDKLPIEHALVARAIALIGTPYENSWDAYLLRYVDGAHVPDHVDAAQHGRRHRWLNAVLTQPRAGGQLFIDDVLVELGVGDAVLFDPDREVHRVSPVEGTRLVFSVGALL